MPQKVLDNEHSHVSLYGKPTVREAVGLWATSMAVEARCQVHCGIHLPTLKIKAEML